MSKQNTLNGKISAGVPGLQGSRGTRASYTFYGDSETVSGSNSFLFYLNNGTEIGRAKGNHSYSPEIGDSIIYKTDSDITLYNIISKYQGKVVVEPVDDFVPETLGQVTKTTTDSSIDIEIDIEPFNINVPVASDCIITPTNLSASLARYKTFNSLVEKAINFVVTSRNSRKLAGFRVMLEFSTNFTSPGVDNITKDLFSDAGKMFRPTFNGTTGPAGRYRTTFRGCAASYSNAQVVLYPASSGAQSSYQKTLNFDKENLETFYILLKDFDDGANGRTYRSTVNLMVPPLVDRGYTCSIIIFVKTTNDFYEKRYVGEINVNDLFDL